MGRATQKSEVRSHALEPTPSLALASLFAWAWRSQGESHSLYEMRLSGGRAATFRFEKYTNPYTHRIDFRSTIPIIDHYPLNE